MSGPAVLRTRPLEQSRGSGRAGAAALEEANVSQEAITLSHHLLRELRRAGRHPELSILLDQVAFAGKTLARELGRAALVGRLGLVGERNATGDAQKKLDVFANQVMIDAFSDVGLIASIVSEELDEIREIECTKAAAYILCTDPLDGSSNIDTNAPVGTIFGFYRRSATGPCHALQELQSGLEMAAAGYILFGPSTILVYTRGQGVHGFTLDVGVGEFLLSNESIRCPDRGALVAADLGRYPEWEAPVRKFADALLRGGAKGARRASVRHTGAFVADLHRILLEGGLYFYPPNAEHPLGKLRLLYECAPLALVAEQAGGRASTGRKRILDLRPESPHQQVPLVIGSRENVDEYERFQSSPAS